MHFHTVQANATKLYMVYTFVQGKVMTGFSRLEAGFLGGFYPVFWKTIRNFLRFFKTFRDFSNFLIILFLFLLFTLSLHQGLLFDPKLSLPRYFIVSLAHTKICLNSIKLICTSKCNEILQGIPFHLEEGQDGVREALHSVLKRFSPVFWRAIQNFLTIKKKTSRFFQLLDYSLPVFTSWHCPWVKNYLSIENFHFQGN